MKPKLIRVGPTARPLFPVTLPQSAPLTAVFSRKRELRVIGSVFGRAQCHCQSCTRLFFLFIHFFLILFLIYLQFWKSILPSSPGFFFLKKRNLQQKKLFFFSFLSDKKKLLQKIVIMPRVVVCYASWL